MRTHSSAKRLGSLARVASTGSRIPAPNLAARTAIRNVLHAPRVQAKLTVGAPNDAFENEADRVAEQVMRMPEEVAATAAPPQIQRMCTDCEEEEKGSGVIQRMCADCEEKMQAKEEAGQTPSVPSGFEQRFAALRGGGQPLPSSERAFFEPRFGRDFANVRLHSSPAASELARSVHARAFTVGDSVVFGSGQYAPGTAAGRQLVAHELTHVVQQGGGAPAAD